MFAFYSPKINQDFAEVKGIWERKTERLKSAPLLANWSAYTRVSRVIIATMTSDILKKLKKELVTGITTEAQVVYLLAGVRKLLELQQAKRQYEHLKFHCDW